MAKPIILTLDDETPVADAVERDLRSQYGRDYRIVKSTAPAEALSVLRELSQRNEEVALLLVDQRMPEMEGTEFLLEAMKIYPDARRALLTAYADTPAAITAINEIGLDHYLMKPWGPADENLYPVLDDLLDDWQAGVDHPYDGIRVAGTLWSPESHAVKDFLARSQVPYRWLDIERDDDAEAEVAAATAGDDDERRLPVVFFPDGTAAVAPSLAELADLVGQRTEASDDFYDVIVIGAGPAGLAAAVYGASEGLRTLLIDKETTGGQAGTSSRIENYLGFPNGISGVDLARRATTQATRLGAEVLTAVEVDGVEITETTRCVRLQDGRLISAHALIVATGVSVRTLDVPGIADLTGAGVYYGAAMTEAANYQGRDVFVVGGANSAGQAAMHFSRFARRVTMLVRGDSLDRSMSRYLIDQIESTGNIDVRTRCEVTAAYGADAGLEAIDITDRDSGTTERTPAAALFLFIGAKPHADFIGNVVERTDAGFIPTGPDLPGGGQPIGWEPDRSPYLLETSVPGIFAVGDVRDGVVRRVASAVGAGIDGDQHGPPVPEDGLTAMADDLVARTRPVDMDLSRYYRDRGWWTDETFAGFIADQVERDPGRRVRIWSDTHPDLTTAGELYLRARRLAGGLQRRGIGAGHVVAYQLPNWSETLVALWAGLHVGAVMVPIIHFYGPAEVDFILRQSGARVLMTCDRFGPIDHLDNLAQIRSGQPDLETVIVIGDESRAASIDGGVGLSALIDDDPVEAATVDPDGPAMVGYTSGTTADPKGVIHTHRTLLFETRQLAGLDTTAGRPVLMASPLAHMTGMLGGSLVPMWQGRPIELIDRWDPGWVLEIMAAEGLSPGGGATVFLTGLLDHPDLGPEHLEAMPTFGLGGAPVPVAVAERAEAMGISVTRAYGSTEHPSITGSTRDLPAAKRNRTDGRPMEGVEIELRDDGEIWSRGPDLCAGYTDPELTAATFDDDGWYATGDVGVLDDDGFLTITDRTRDIIIRGGLNLSAAEIEEHVAAMDQVAEVAVVARPDERLGETACAVIRVRPETDAPDLATVQAAVDTSGLAKQKWPESVEIVEDFPRTPSGKIQKFALRDRLRDEPS